MTFTPDQPPGHPFTPRQIRMLRLSVIIMGVLIILGLIALIYGMARQAKKLSTPREPSIAETLPSGTPFSGHIPNAGGEVKSMVLDQGTLAIHMAPAEGQGGAPGQIILFDIRRNREIGRIRLDGAQ